MIARALDFLASLATSFRLQAFGPVILETCQREEVDGQEAWDAFQAAFNRKAEMARLRHGRVSEVEDARQEVLHSALARSVPGGEVAA